MVSGVLTRVEEGAVQAIVSTINELEVLVKPLRARDRRALTRAVLFFRRTPNLLVRPVDRVVARRAADVRARTGLAVPDAVIVATSLEERCDALIGNDARMAARAVGVPYLYLEDYV
jgi:predicted nucleic acid-binding protein